MKVANPYFLVRCLKQEEQEKRTKIGLLSLHPSYVYMDRNTQNGEVVDISDRAHKAFEEVEIGDVILLHHFCQGDTNESNEEHLVFSDNEYNYYVVSPKDHNGKRNEVYGVYKNDQIITHPDFLLLEVEGSKEEVPESTGSLVLTNDWKESREEKAAKMQQSQKELQNLAAKMNMSENLKRGIEEKEADLAKRSKQLNKLEYLPYKLAAFHPSLQSKLHKEVAINDDVFCLNMAVNTLIEFKDKTYRTVNLKFAALAT